MPVALPSAKNRYFAPIMGSFFCACALLFTGCASKPTPITETSVTELNNSHLLESASASLKAREFGNAALALQALQERPLTGQDKIEALLLNLELGLATGRVDEGRPLLQSLAELMDAANSNQEIRYSLLKAQYLEAVGQYLAAARERDFQAAILSGADAESNHELIFQDLMRVPEEEFNSLNSAQMAPQFAQWLQLAQISRNPRLALDELLAEVKRWQKSHPSHPGAQKLPGGLALLQDAANKRPTQVALLLPLSGPLAKTGAALRDGFMAAYYESLNKGFSVPKVQLYDSLQYPDINAAYSQAQLDGAQWLVGPVTKPDVQALSERDSLPLPTLALNYSDKTSDKTSAGPQNLYQFGLAAEDEAVQIADKAWGDGKRTVLALLPQGNWGERIYTAFKNRWLELGGTIADQRYYPNRPDYNPDVRALLNVNDSQQRYNTMRQILRQETEFEPSRRDDADWVFLVALPQQARQIKPTLAFNFAGDLPVYATSHLYSGEVQPNKDRDLNGIIFCDAPWLLQYSLLAQQVEKAVPGGQGSYARLYAMGVDAFRLLPRLKQLELLPYSQVFGSTGSLHLDAQRRIVRRTDCTQFAQGQPRQLSGRQ